MIIICDRCCTKEILMINPCIRKSQTITLVIITIFSISSCIAATTSISDIQGSGLKSLMEGQIVSLSAIVTGDFQNNDKDTLSNLGGFYIQQKSTDNDSSTSDGIFVFDGKKPSVDVNVGDTVELTGTVREFYGETQIKAISVKIFGTGQIEPVEISLPVNSLMSNSRGKQIANLERYEGMLIRIPQKLTVSSLRYLEQFGEVNLVQGGRTQQFTNNNQPNPQAYSAHLNALAARSIIFDDGMNSPNPATLRHLSAGNKADYSIRLGDSISGVVGIIHYSKGSGGRGTDGWRIEPTGHNVFNSENPKIEKPLVAGQLQIASFNVLNFFSTVDDGKTTCKCRGADSSLELNRQLDKTVTALKLMDSDIIGLIELENNTDESIAMIVNALNARLGADKYAYIDTGKINTDAIKTGFIYNTFTIKANGKFALLTTAIDPRFDDRRHRPALAQTFEVRNTGAKLTIVVNHLKSKGSSCESSGDPDMHDGQGNCNVTRTKAVRALADWIATDPTSSGDKDFLIIGDLNAYTIEDPLTSLKNSGYTNLLESNKNAYSYNYDNQIGALDHAFASPSLLSQVRETFEWHINSDEPRLFDYNLEYGRDAKLFEPNSPYRSSDHDPIIVGLDLKK